MMLSEVQKKALKHVDRVGGFGRSGITYVGKGKFSSATYRALSGRGLIKHGVHIHQILWWEQGKRIPEYLEQHKDVFRITPAGRAALRQANETD